MSYFNILQRYGVGVFDISFSPRTSTLLWMFWSSILIFPRKLIFFFQLLDNSTFCLTYQLIAQLNMENNNLNVQVDELSLQGGCRKTTAELRSFHYSSNTKTQMSNTVLKKLKLPVYKYCTFTDSIQIVSI